jgi:nucleoside-diphosphate kinase
MSPEREGKRVERTLVIVKPDGVQRGLISEVLGRIERRGLKLVGLKLTRIDQGLAERHYGIHKGKPFYEGLVSYITSGPVVVAAFEGPSAIEIVRNTVGATNPVQAAAGTIRGDFAVSIGRNLVHASDSPENGQHEVGLFFDAGELVDWEPSLTSWILE